MENIRERLILHIFREILSTPDLGPEDGFFEAGGDSLLATDAVIRISADTGLDVEVAELIMAPTAQALALALDSLAT